MPLHHIHLIKGEDAGFLKLDKQVDVIFEPDIVLAGF